MVHIPINYFRERNLVAFNKLRKKMCLAAKENVAIFIFSPVVCNFRVISYL